MTNITPLVNDLIRRPNGMLTLIVRILDSISINTRILQVQYLCWNLAVPVWIECERIDQVSMQTYKTNLGYTHSDERGHYYQSGDSLLGDLGFAYISISVRITDIEQSVLIGNKRSMLITLIGNYKPLSEHYETLIFTPKYDEEFPHKIISLSYHTIQIDGK